MYYNFKQDLEQAHKGERLAKKLLEPSFGTFSIMDGDFPQYDLKGGFFNVEVKSDLFSKKSNRVAVEFEKIDGTPTGLNVTTAEKYFVICYDKEWSHVIDGQKFNGWWIGLLINSSILKELLNAHNYPVVIGGDDKRTRMCLMPVEVLRELSDQVYMIKSPNLPESIMIINSAKKFQQFSYRK